MKKILKLFTTNSNFQDMKSMFASLKQLQKAFEQSPYKSIDYFLEILLLANQAIDEPSTTKKIFSNNSSAFKSVAHVPKPETEHEILAKNLKKISPSLIKSVSIRIRSDETSPSDGNKRTNSFLNIDENHSNKLRKLPSSVTIDVASPTNPLHTGSSGIQFKYSRFRLETRLVLKECHFEGDYRHFNVTEFFLILKNLSAID